MALGVASAAVAAETDNVTFRYVPLEDSAAKLNAQVNSTLEAVAGRANADLQKSAVGPVRATDLEAELAFVRAYREIVLRRFLDRLLPVVGACVESNDCAGWPRFERIVLNGEESIYGESRYNRIAESSLAPTFRLCGVRMGTDKLTHLFSNGFFYYNASRREGSRIRTDDDARRAALADERGLMGAKSTAVASPADAEATLAGFRFARDELEGPDPVFERDASTGLLRKRRDVDVCSYVAPGWDEEVNPPEFTASRARVARIRAAIDERRAANAKAETSMSAEEKRALAKDLLSRPLPESHGRLPFFYKIYVALKWAVAYFTVPEDSREAISYLVFPKFRAEGRRPISLRRGLPGAQRFGAGATRAAATPAPASDGLSGTAAAAGAGCAGAEGRVPVSADAETRVVPETATPSSRRRAAMSAFETNRSRFRNQELW